MGSNDTMRIGIDARFLTHPQEGGFKTYTQNLVRGLMDLDDSNEYILYTDRPSARWRSRGNFVVKALEAPSCIREQFMLHVALVNDCVDLAHLPCNTAPIGLPCPYVLTIHDLIPCMPCRKRRSKGSIKSRMLTSYWKMVIPQAARGAKKIITVSESSKTDIQRLLQIPEDRITVVPTGLHPDFHPVEDKWDRQMVRERYGLPERFILGFVSSDPRKNLIGILDAAGLALGTHANIGLVLICSSNDARSAALAALGQREPLRRTVLLDPVPRTDLAVIYTLADTLVFPSFYEGFGLPVIEAMACGTPVVTSNISSLPEVAGGAALLVDPNSSREISEAVVRIITDESLRAELVTKGLKRAADFSYDRTASETISVYQSVFEVSVGLYRRSRTARRST